MNLPEKHLDSKPKQSLKPITRDIFASAAKETGTDKYQIHGYHRFYPLALSQINREDPFTLIEIGYGNGASIPMWHILFPNAYIICIDKDVSLQGANYTVIKADQSDPESIIPALAQTKLPVRLIIDDGSHHPRHQLTSFSELFEAILEPGGQYIIEDIETSYWLSGNLYGNEIRFGLFNKWSAIESLKLAVDYLNRTYLSEDDISLLEYSMAFAGLSPSAAKQISSATFGQNCVILRKAVEGDEQYIDRPYSYSAFTRR